MGDAEPPEAHGADPGGDVAPERERGDESAFEALREDFHFNLRLLRERDAHIDNLEAELARLRAAVELDASNALEASRARDEASRALDAKHASSPTSENRRKRNERLLKKARKLMPKLKIMFTFSQLVAGFDFILNVRFPEPFASVMNALDSLNMYMYMDMYMYMCMYMYMYMCM